ncbi:uncharacterized protein LOC131188564 isoform X3 [Ahaetulla prasina]|uniref:uncharacterized protein LOC131188564 isoform X3 n=1 Tax=Ahaetulla prasina TaxID=499056 RepID=UPI0026475376|nr:uncharacterized protein LOC131188564 isoform X3 [Ahaetulla prasina]
MNHLGVTVQRDSTALCQSVWPKPQNHMGGVLSLGFKTLLFNLGLCLAVRPLWLPTAVLQWHALRPLQQLKLPVEELLVVAALAQGRPPALQMDGWIQPRVPDRQNLRSDLSSWKESEVTLNGPWV